MCVCLLLQNLSISKYVGQAVCLYICKFVLGHNFGSKILIFSYNIVIGQNREGAKFQQNSIFT